MGEIPSKTHQPTPLEEADAEQTPQIYLQQFFCLFVFCFLNCNLTAYPTAARHRDTGLAVEANNIQTWQH